jgi:hypothetical protein
MKKVDGLRMEKRFRLTKNFVITVMSGLRCLYEIVNGKDTEVNFYWLTVASYCSMEEENADSGATGGQSTKQ